MSTSLPTVRKLLQTLTTVESNLHPNLLAIQELLGDLERALTEYGVLLRRKQPVKDEGVLIGLKVRRLELLTGELRHIHDVSELYKLTLRAVTELVTEIEQAFDNQFLQEKP